MGDYKQYISIAGQDRQQPRRLSLPIIAVFALQLIYESVMATLGLTYLVPTDAFNCGLEQQWLRLFSGKNGDAIRAIQDKHNCCGLRSTLDKAWPFPDKTHKANACVVAFKRTKACLEEWRQDQQATAGLFLLAVLLVFAAKV
jgi:hypothetical protein